MWVSAPAACPRNPPAGALPALSAFGSLDSMISTDAMQEFRLQTSTTVAEFGRMPGANIAVSSRGGSDEFHGVTAFRDRNYQFDANDWFANRAGVGRPALTYQDFSQSFGGPVRRGHTFFFLTYEHIYLNQPYVWEQPVPSVRLRGSGPSTPGSGGRRGWDARSGSRSSQVVVSRPVSTARSSHANASEAEPASAAAHAALYAVVASREPASHAFR